MEGKEEEEGFAHLCWDAALIANASLFNLSQGPLPGILEAVHREWWMERQMNELMDEGGEKD